MISSASDAGALPPVAEIKEEANFKKALGPIDAVAVVVGSMIGSGIFIVSAETARHVGCPGLLLGCWLMAGFMTVAGALCYSELAAMFPKAGGQYVFLREAYGPLAAFLYGWTLFTVIQSGTIAAVGVAFAKFLGVFMPQISNANVLVSIGSWHLSAVQLVSVVLVTVLTGINCTGVDAAKKIQTYFTVTKVLALGSLIVLGLLSFNKFYGLSVNLAHFWSAQDLDGHPLSGLKLVTVMGLAMVGAIFSCDAWNNITFASEEVKDAEKVLPRSLAIGTVLVVALYVMANVVYLLLLPLHGDASSVTVAGHGIQFATEDRVGTAAAEIIFGPVGRYVMAGAIIISTFGCVNGLILAGARVYYAMAKDGLFFKKAGMLNSATCVPTFGLIIQGVWTTILTTTGTYSNLLEYVVFAALLFYVLTVGALIILRKNRPDAPRPYKVIAYPLLPVLYLVAAIAVMAGLIQSSPTYSGAGLLIILSGLPAYFIWRRKGQAQNTGA